MESRIVDFRVDECGPKLPGEHWFDEKYLKLEPLKLKQGTEYVIKLIEEPEPAYAVWKCAVCVRPLFFVEYEGADYYIVPSVDFNRQMHNLLLKRGSLKGAVIKVICRRKYSSGKNWVRVYDLSEVT